MASTNIIQSKLTEWEKGRAGEKFVASSGSPLSAVPPQIESVTLCTSSKYQLGENGNIEVMVTLSDPVIVTGTPTLRIEFYPGETKDAKYESGSGTKNLLFRYTVEKGDHSKEISVPAGTIIQFPGGSAIKSVTTCKSLLLVNSPAFYLTPKLQVTGEFDEVEVSKQVEYLSKRSNLATVVVEGNNDTVIYRWIEERLASHVDSHLTIDPLPAGDRSNLLEIYNRRGEFSSRIPVAFLADLDYQVLADPTLMLRHYPDIIWTTGYSLENDLYTDANPTQLIKQTDFKIYNAALKVVIETFASEVTRWHTGGIKQDLRNQYLAAISTNASLKLRGKDLYSILEYFHSPTPRMSKHSPTSRMSKRLIDVTGNHRPLITRLILEILNKINKQFRKLPPDRKSAVISLPKPS